MKSIKFKKMSQKNTIFFFGGAILLILAILGFFVINQNNKNQSSQANTLINSSDFKKAGEGRDLSGKIYYLTRNNDSLNIVFYDLSSKENKFVFTDKDEISKLTTSGSYAYLSREYIGIQKNDNKNQIVSFKFSDNLDKKVLNENFISTQSIAVSPDGKIIFYSVLENQNYYLYQMTRDNKNLRQLYVSEKLIDNIVVDKNGDSIAFVLGGERVVVLNLDTLKERVFFHSSGRIQSLNWHENGSLILSESNDEKSLLGKIISIDKEAKKKNVLETKKGFPDSPIISPDFLATAYVLKIFEEKYDSNQSGEGNYTLIGDEVLNKMAEGIKILAWIK